MANTTNSNYPSESENNPRKSRSSQKMISFIIPVYNEAQSVNELYSEILDATKSLPYSYEIIFIDDGSTDDTLNELRKLSSATILSFTRNFGKSQALQAGFDEAKGDYIITLDSDLQDDPNEIPQFIKKAEENNADLICGWKQKRADPTLKRIVSRFANFVTRKLTGAKVHDMNCCFKLYKRNVAKSIRFYGDMHRYVPSIVAGMGFSIDEIPVHHRPRKYGKTKYGIGRLASGLFDFLTLIFLRKFIDRPMHFFGMWGFALTFIGSGILIYLAWIRIFFEELIGGRPLLLLGLLLVIVGFQVFSLGFLGELIIRQATDNKRNFLIKEKIINERSI